MPSLIEALPQMNQRDRDFVSARLRTTTEEQRRDWRGWNLAEYRARRAVEQNTMDFQRPNIENAAGENVVYGK